MDDKELYTIGYDFKADLSRMRNYLKAKLAEMRRPTLDEEMQALEIAVTARRIEVMRREREKYAVPQYAKCA